MHDSNGRNAANFPHYNPQAEHEVALDSLEIGMSSFEMSLIPRVFQTGILRTEPLLPLKYWKLFLGTEYSRELTKAHAPWK